MPLRLLIVALLLFAVPLMAEAEEGMVIGDQIGVGMDWAAELPSVAHYSVALYNGEVLTQLRQAPRGTTVFMSLGVNDAVTGALDVHKRVAEIIATRDALGVKLVWIGPPCVLKPWETYAKKLDEILRAELQGTDVMYVSLQDAIFCDPTMHSADGVFFNLLGYRRIWAKAATVDGFPVVVLAAPVVTATPISSPTSAQVVTSPPATAAPQPIPVAVVDRRVALVIGNSNYKNAALTNPTRDADLVSASLRKAGFDVIEVKDADFAKFDAALTRFVAEEEGADIALFYFAGHGFALAGDDLRPRNYLMATSADMNATSDAMLRREGFSIDEIVNRISKPAKVTLAFIDACRNDPFHRGSGERGFEPIGVASSRQVYIGMSTQLGKTSRDGVGGMGSPFALAFVEKMTTPGLRIDDAFRALREEVSEETHGMQQPEILQDDLKQGALVLVRAP